MNTITFLSLPIPGKTNPLIIPTHRIQVIEPRGDNQLITDIWLIDEHTPYTIDMPSDQIKIKLNESVY